MAVSNIALTSSMRSNLLSLQNTQKMFDTTQNRLSTGKKVNSAMDNPSNFFTAQSLTARANDLSSLMDSIGQAVSTLETADKGITTLTKYVEQAKSLANSARDTMNVKSSATSSVRFDAPNVKTQLVTDAGSLINAGDAFTIRLGSSTNMTGTQNLNESQTLADIGMTLGTNPLEIIVDGEVYTFAVSAAGTPPTYDATTKTSTLAVDTKIKDFMADIVENVGRKTISAELIDGRMTIKTLNSAPLVIRSEADQLDGATVSGKDLKAQIVAAAEGAKTTATTAWTGTTTVGALKSDIAKMKEYLTSALDVAESAGNTQAPVSRATLSAQLAALNGLLGAINTDVDAPGSGLTDASTVANVLAAAGSSVAAGYTNAAGVTAIQTTATVATTAARTELAAQSITIDGTAYNITSSTTVDGLVDQINLTGNFNAINDGGDLRIRSLSSAAGAPNTGMTEVVTREIGAAATAVGVTLSSGDTSDPKTAFNDMLGFDNGSKITIKAGMTAEDLRKALVGIEGVFADFNDKGNLIVYGEQGDDFIIMDKSGKAAEMLGIQGAATNGNNARATYAKQFDGVMEQIDQLVQDTSYKGINLLKGDDLTVNFNETRTSQLEIKGVIFDSKGIGLTVSDNEWKTNEFIDKSLTQIEKATSVLRAQASEFGQNLATVQTREEFTSGMINNLVSGSDKLTLADMNEEAANMLALQTRQQLATNSLSMASQAAQSVLKLF